MTKKVKNKTHAKHTRRYDQTLEIALGVVGGLLLVVLVAGTIRMARSSGPSGAQQFREAGYRTFDDEDGTVETDDGTTTNI